MSDVTILLVIVGLLVLAGLAAACFDPKKPLPPSDTDDPQGEWP